MAIQVGDRIPEAKLRTMSADGPQEVNTADLLSKRKVVLFAVPGAFTPTCHLRHLPTFVQQAEALKQKGVDTIACLAVNDVFVLDAWAKSTGAQGRIVFLSDGNAEFTRKLGMELDASGAGLGTRSKRYAMVVDNGVVKALHVEPQAGQALETTADKILADL